MPPSFWDSVNNYASMLRNGYGLMQGDSAAAVPMMQAMARQQQQPSFWSGAEQDARNLYNRGAAAVNNFMANFSQNVGAPQQVSDFWNGPAYVARHPLDSASLLGHAMLQAQQQQYQRYLRDKQAGNYGAAAVNYLYSGIPLIGPALGTAGDQFRAHQYAAGLGSTLGVAAGLGDEALMANSVRAPHPGVFWNAADVRPVTPPISAETFGTHDDMVAGLSRAFPNNPAFNPELDPRLAGPNVNLTNPPPQFTEWPAEYRNAPQTLSANGQGGANYTAADLAALKAKYGIADAPAPVTAPNAIPDFEAQLAAHNANGGSTFHPVEGNLAGTDRFSLSLFPELTQKINGDLTVQHLQDFYNKNAALFQQNPNLALGSWRDPSGTNWLDVSATTNDLNTAHQLGRKYNQQSIYDLLQGREISTGGSGEPVPNLPPAAQRLAELQNADPLTLLHWSTQPGLENLDVSKFGTSTVSGAERNRANEPGFLPRVYMGEPGQYFEPRITNRPYQYSGQVNPGRYYDIANDPLGIWQAAYQQGGPTAAENAIHDAGFSGYRGHGAVASFDNVPVQPAASGRGLAGWGNVRRNPVGNSQLGAVRPDVFLAPFEWATKAAAKHFESIVPPSVAEHLPLGWENILRTPKSQQTMLDVRNSLSSPAEVQAAAQFAQQRGYNWYEKSRLLPQAMSQVDRDLMPEERVPQFLNVGAATSARTRVPRNLAQTLESWNMLRDEGFPSEENFVRGLFNNPRTSNPPDIDMKGAKFPNIGRAMSDQPLGGLKIFSFGGDLNMGHHGTVDTIEGVGLGMAHPEKASKPTNYLAGRSILSKAADNLGTDIHQVQSSHWTGIQSTGLLKNPSLRTADPADVIANMRKNLESTPAMDFASVAIDALEGRHYTADYARIDRAIRQGFGNDETKINNFLNTLKGELEPLNRAAAEAPLGQANSRQLRSFVRRVQRSSANRAEE